MKKFLVLLLVLFVGPLLGAAYGIIHDQVTYSVSEEYYTKFKFIQFGIDGWGLGYNIGTDEMPEIKLNQPRSGVTIVGVMATWWVGLVIGLILGPLGLIHPSAKQMFKVTIGAIVLTTIVALLIGFLGLLYGKFFLISDPPHWYYPANLVDKQSFILVGSMHHFSYLGGLIGLLAGVIYSIKQRIGLLTE